MDAHHFPSTDGMTEKEINERQIASRRVTGVSRNLVIVRFSPSLLPLHYRHTMSDKTDVSRFWRIP